MTISHWYFEGNPGRNFQQRSYCRVSPDAWRNCKSGAMGMELQPRLQQGRVMSSVPCQPGKTTDILQKLMRTATRLGSPRPWGIIPSHRVHKCQTLALRLKFVLLGFGLAVDQLLLILYVPFRMGSLYHSFPTIISCKFIICLWFCSAEHGSVCLEFQIRVLTWALQCVQIWGLLRMEWLYFALWEKYEPGGPRIEC